MSIIDTFDFNGEEIIKASNVIKKLEDLPKTILVSFSEKFRSFFLSKYDAKELCCLKAGGLKFSVYKFQYKGIDIGFFNSIVGGAGASGLLEELIALGAEKFLYFGSCGALDKEIAEGHLLVPVSAYRDEGVSYHYSKASDYLEIESAPRLIKIFDELHIPYNTTKTWTTDAFYRETTRNLNSRKQEGCGVVEMECASIMSVGQFRKKEVYQFLYAADCLGNDTWDQRILGKMPEDLREKILTVAIEVASRI